MTASFSQGSPNRCSSGRFGLHRRSLNMMDLKMMDLKSIKRPLWVMGAGLWVFSLAVGQAQAQDAVYAAPPVEVIGVAPLHGTGVPRDKIPANVKLLNSRQLQDTGALNLGSALYREFGSVTVNDGQNNPFQRDVNVRGYVASPLLGNAQGLAVYMNGSRINEGFGEEVQWDLIPDFAIDQVQLIPGANPVYGLNALGGSLSLQMKNGFDHSGLQVSFTGGSFGRFSETLEYGLSVGDYAAYVGISRHDEDGWRDYSPSELTRIFTDVRYRGDRFNASVSANLASTDLNGNGASPVGLLAINREAVFTHPDNTQNRLAHIVANAAYDVNATTTIEANAYYRLLERKTLNGDEFEAEECLGDELIEKLEDANLIGAGRAFTDGDNFNALLAGLNGPFGDDPADFEELICAEVEEDEFEELNAEFDSPDGDANEVREEVFEVITNSILVKADGTLLSEDDLGGEEEAKGAYNRSETVTNSLGGSVQASFDQPLFGFDNLLIAGTSIDHSSTDYNNSAEIGELNATRGVDSFDPSVFLSTSYGFDGTNNPDREDTLYSYRSNLKGKTTAVGIYFSDSLDLTDSLTATLAGRFNWAEVTLEDRLASTKDKHNYSRFNPSVGLTYQFDHRLGLFANYSEANRAPSPVELSCADEDNPCRVPNAFLADPPLEQVVNRSIEIGARGSGLQNDLSYAWALTGFAGRNYDDILFTRAADEKPVGTGFFKNAGTTQRLGAEMDFNARWRQLAFFARYAYIDATFRSAVEFPAHELLDFAGEETDLENNTRKGDRIPGIPRHNVRLGLDYFVTDAWKIGVEGIVASNQVMRGDEGNAAPKVKGYGLMNLRTSYSLNDKIEMFLWVENVFDTKYNTFGLVGENPREVMEEANGDDFADRIGSDNRFLGPGAPRGIWGGFRIGF